MSEIRVEVRAGAAHTWRLPAPDAEQAEVCRRATSESLLVRGAPGSGRTTCGLMVAQGCGERGESALMWVPDRARADTLEARAQAVLPDTVRPVRTPAAFAYLLVTTWRTVRADPLGPLELVTGAQEDQLIASLLAREDVAWPDGLTPQMRALPAFRMELRNLFARAGEAGVTGPALSDLGRRFARPAWVSAGALLDAYEDGPGFALTTRGPMSVDTSRIQRIAADVLRHWDEDAGRAGVGVAPPLPEVVVVDDLQDCTASTVELLAAMSERGVRVLAFADPDVAVATYRGGEPHLDQRLAARLGADTVELGAVHRGTRALRELVRDATAHITTTGPLHRRQVGVAAASVADPAAAPVADPAVTTAASPVTADEGGRDRAHADLHVHLTASDAQLGALLAHHLRAHHLHEGIPWEDQVVLVRSQGAVDEVRHQLRRGGVPVGARRRAVAFASEPVTRTLLELAVGRIGRDAALGDTGTPEGESESGLARQLLSSPFVQADPLDVHRLLRALNSRVVAAGGDSGDEDDVDLVGATHDVVDLLTTPSLGEAAAEDLRVALTRAARMWTAADTAGSARPRQQLWALWEASGRAQEWRAGALGGDADAEWFDDQLDAVLALFRVADVWEQRTPGGTARAFALQLLADDVPTDTIARVGMRPPGVEVLTPAQAMGREWEVVAVVGVQDGRWPNLRLRDRVLRADLLADLAMGRGDADADGAPRLLDDARTARRGVLDDEWRLFAAALSRSRRILHVGAVRAEQEAPSPFVDVVARHAPLDLVEGEIPLEPVPPSLDLPGQVGRLRHLAAQPNADPTRDVATTLLAVLAHEGVLSADPRRWSGAGGISSDSPVLSAPTVWVSPSKVQAALECPLKWFLASAQGAPGAGQAQQLGTLVHAIAEHHPHGPLEDMLEELETHWDQLGHDDSTWVGRRAHEHARAVVCALADYVDTVPGVVTTEVRVDVPLGDLVVGGSIDRLEVVDEGVRVVDLKTGKHPGAKDSGEDHPQLATYQVALLAQGTSVAGARLVFLGNEKVERREQSALEGDHLDQWRTRLEELSTTMRGSTFMATPSQGACQFCAFARACPAKDQGRRTLA